MTVVPPLVRSTAGIVGSTVNPFKIGMLVEQDGPTAIFLGRWILQVFCDDV
jgi:hypothetical protein